MNKKLRPSYTAKSIFSLDIRKIKDNGFDYVFVDLDNTLANPYVKNADNNVIELINEFKCYNLVVTVLSNNHEQRVKEFTKNLDINYLFEVKKPSKKKLESYLFKNNIDASRCLVIGDQIMTDICMANKLNIVSILVDPLTKQDEPITFFPRLLDKFFRKQMKKENIVKEF